MFDRRRFVVLEHRWNGVHWDFMVETAPGGPLRTWAVDAEPAPSRDLPARALADHRRDYLTYEGELSGDRGSVRRWDEGTCVVEAWEAGRVVLELAGAQLTGRLELSRTPAGTGAGAGSASGAGGSVSWTFRLGKVC